jgi:hypothetical protein
MHKIPDPALADTWHRLVSAGRKRIDHQAAHYLPRIGVAYCLRSSALNTVQRLVYDLDSSRLHGVFRFRLPPANTGKDADT